MNMFSFEVMTFLIRWLILEPLAFLFSPILFLLLPWLAEENILVTTVKEGTAKGIMRGKSFDRFVMSFEGYHLNDPKKSWFNRPEVQPNWEILYHGKENDAKYDDRHWILKHLGLYWVGWPWANSVYVYGFVWNETYTDRDGKEHVYPRAAATDFIQVNDFVYAIVTDQAETSDLLPTDVLTLVTVAIRNPYNALFSGEDWMQRVTAAINRHAKFFIGGKSYEEHISSIKTGGGESQDQTEFSQPITRLTKSLPDDPSPNDAHYDASAPSGLRGRYGVVIRTADMQTLELSGTGKDDHQKAAAKVFVATKEAQATRITGQADADVIEMKGRKEAHSVLVRAKILERYGENGRLLAQLDAIEKSTQGQGTNTIWANNPLIAVVEKLTGKGGDKS